MITETTVKSVFTRQAKIDSWFLSRYKAGLYRGCMHNCAYCDGRSEKYNVEGEFGKDIIVKSNAPELLEREMNPSRKRLPISGYLMIGSGVTDSYQPVETHYGLMRKALEIACRYRYPVHVLTKSTLVERDADILKIIKKQNSAIVSFSFSSADDKISRVFEPGVPPPSERLKTIARLKQEGLHCGIFLMPVIPYLTDTREKMEEMICKASEAGTEFIIFGGMTLKPGRQKDHFFSVLNDHYPQLMASYRKLYGNDDSWGNPDYSVYREVENGIAWMASKYRIPKRIPPHIYQKILCTHDLVIVILEHLDYLMRLKSKKNPFGQAARIMAKLPTIPGKTLFNDVEIPGISGETARIVNEIMQTSRCTEYERLVYE
ncbi:MAG: radical SAM protein [Bacteroidia bacterium]|nr:radical SAM protein [Bacteroidia bacterium]